MAAKAAGLGPGLLQRVLRRGDSNIRVEVPVEISDLRQHSGDVGESSVAAANSRASQGR